MTAHVYRVERREEYTTPSIDGLHINGGMRMVRVVIQQWHAAPRDAAFPIEPVGPELTLDLPQLVAEGLQVGYFPMIDEWWLSFGHAHETTPAEAREDTQP